MTLTDLEGNSQQMTCPLWEECGRNRSFRSEVSYAKHISKHDAGAYRKTCEVPTCKYFKSGKEFVSVRYIFPLFLVFKEPDLSLFVFRLS